MIIDRAELRGSARKLLASIVSAHPDDAWQRITEAGWPALIAPESRGGLEQDLTTCCWLYMELGRALSPALLPAALLATATLGACAASRECDAWIERIVSGQRLAVSLLEPTSVSTQGHSLQAVLGADRADHALIVSTCEPLIAIIPLDRNVQSVPWPTWDVTRTLFDLDVSNLHFNDATVIARGAAAEAALSAFSIHLNVAIAADCIGAASKILDDTVTHLKTRRQFDRPLAMFQALKHRCADLKTTILAAEALLLEYVANIDMRPLTEGVALARGAKSIASTAFRTVAEDAMQMHGGISMAAEHPCHLYLKRALLNEQLASQNDVCDVTVARAFIRSLAA